MTVEISRRGAQSMNSRAVSCTIGAVRGVIANKHVRAGVSRPRSLLQARSSLRASLVIVIAVVFLVMVAAASAETIPPQPPDEPSEGFCEAKGCAKQESVTAAPRHVHLGGSVTLTASYSGKHCAFPQDFSQCLNGINFVVEGRKIASCQSVAPEEAPGGGTTASCTFTVPANASTGAWIGAEAEFGTQPCCVPNAGTYYYVSGNQETQGTLSGHVTGPGGAPSGGVQVTISGSSQTFSATTDSTGFYSIELTNGSYQVSAGANFVPLEAQVNVQGATTQDFTAQPVSPPPPSQPPPSEPPPVSHPPAQQPPAPLPAGVRVASLTTVTCNLDLRTFHDTCGAVVADAGPTQGASPPTGIVDFSIVAGSDTRGSFVPNATCTLVATPRSINESSCTVQFAPLSSGFAHIAASYLGDTRRSPSVGETKLAGALAPAPETLPGDFLSPPSIDNSSFTPGSDTPCPPNYIRVGEICVKNSGPGPGGVLSLNPGFGLNPGFRWASAASTDASASRRKRSRGTTVHYTLMGPAAVRFTVVALVEGRRGKKGRCVKATRSTRKAKKCERLLTVPGSLTLESTAGANEFRFQGWIGGHKLKPGRYRLLGSPSLQGARGVPVSSSPFKIIAR